MQIPAVLTFDPEWFPEPSLALTEPNGLLAVGGDLSTTRLLHAYQRGIFPWDQDEHLHLWWSPDPRAIIELDSFKCSRSLSKLIKQDRFDISMDQVCHRVIDACAKPRRESHGTWITPEMINSYQQLHDQGHVHSVEVWDDNELVGGLYGVVVGSVFCGESMFSLQTNASKCALYCLVKQLQAWQFAFIDCQVPNPHLQSLGATLIPRERFLERLKRHRSQAITANWNRPRQKSSAF